jgi:hypothetical protein
MGCEQVRQGREKGLERWMAHEARRGNAVGRGAERAGWVHGECRTHDLLGGVLGREG